MYHYEVVPGAEPGDKMVPAGEVRYRDVEAVAGQEMGVVGQNGVYPLPGEEPSTGAYWFLMVATYVCIRNHQCHSISTSWFWKKGVGRLKD